MDKHTRVDDLTMARKALRDDRGRYRPGTCGGPGRLPRVMEARYLAAMHDCLSIEEWCAIVRRAIDDAKAGDGKARMWLSVYALGRPRQPMYGSGDDQVAQAYIENGVLIGRDGKDDLGGLFDS